MIKLDRESSAVSALELDADSNTVTATFKGNGQTYTYSGVKAADIQTLLNDEELSVGQWINSACVRNPQATAVKVAAW